MISAVRHVGSSPPSAPIQPILNCRIIIQCDEARRFCREQSITLHPQEKTRKMQCLVAIICRLFVYV
jgi:hypothetical protein